MNQQALLTYAKEAANFSTNYQLPTLQFALNHRHRPDVDMFDFTCMSRAENAALVRDYNGAKLLIGLVGDCLVEVSVALVWSELTSGRASPQWEKCIFQTYLTGTPIQLETVFPNLVLVYNFSPNLGVEIQHIWKAAG